ncbi:MAG TPA: ABC transporter permease [Candidatus Magasanikbacteria bacterium]|nr:ABC transporter permease [Candidatus Magasanikbacteria bacterium]
MLYSDIFEETFFSLSANKSRSALTVLGIVIGIASVIAMISVGQGSAKSITDRVSSLGTNLLTITPGSQRGQMVRGGMGSAQTLILDDALAIKQIGGIDYVAPTVSSRKQITVKGSNTNSSVTGIDSEYFPLRNIELEVGGNFTEMQFKSKNKVVILGPTTRDTLFGENVDPVGQKIRIDGQEFTVVGVTKAKGGTGMGSMDDLVYVPLGTAQQYITGNNRLNNISVQVSKANLMSSVQAEITALLLERHKISDAINADFSIMNQADMLSTMTEVTDTMTMLLAAIAGISLIVGGIGIMNMMLTTVTERTREIGLRKSLGATNEEVTAQFLSEAVTLTFFGGVIGVAVGWLASWMMKTFFSITTAMTLGSVLLSFGVAAIIGIVFGYYPARKAAKLDPIDALRYQ